MAEIDIEVKQGILETYHNYTYKPPQVFAEFIDNAIQSYEDNKNSILLEDPNFILRVDINIEWERDPVDNVVRAKEITIEDNAAGMNSQKFADAFKSADMTVMREGMNEFGMGMKVAACWLGKKWRVETKSITEQVTHSLEIDVESISRGNIKQVSSKDTFSPEKKHGTRIVVTKMWPQIKQNNFEELKDGIASIYRYFLRQKIIQIFVNEQMLTFENYEILKAPAYNNLDGPSIEWKKLIDVDYDGTGKYKVTGFIALLKEMDDQKRGVVFLRRNRVVMGFDASDRTIGKKIMGQAGSNKYRRVFGELEISGFEVAFGKNQVLDIDTLESLMKAVAGKVVIDGVNLLTQADKYRKKASRSSSSPVSPKPEPPRPVYPTPEPQKQGQKLLDTPVQLPKTSYFKFGGNDWQFIMDSTSEINDLFANDASRKNENILGCKINVNHPFFQVYGQPTEQSLAIIKALSIANYISTIDGRGSVVKFFAEFQDLINE